MAEAQRNYDAIAWRENLGMTAEAATLQEATIDYEAAKAAYAEATAPADDSELQSALSAAQSAQVQLDELRDSPTEAQIATAQAQLASAQATLDDLLDGADAQEVRNAEISLEQALLDLEEAYANLAAATITAPMDGAVLEISATRGEQINAGAVAATMADTGLLELTIDVAEVDIVQVAAGQPVDVEIDALSGRTFAGVVDTIAPATDATTGVVSYPVTIRLTDDDLTGVRPGMTAVATIRNTTAAAEGSCQLVPTSAIQTRDGVSQMTVVRGESSQKSSRWSRVHPGRVDGGAFRSPSGRQGIQGSLASYVNESSGRQFGGPGNGVFAARRRRRVGPAVASRL
ncbi:MAG: efflux RND transporter periplasmic adaptor subunit [Caldilineaceae bacterium]